MFQTQILGSKFGHLFECIWGIDVEPSICENLFDFQYWDKALVTVLTAKIACDYIFETYCKILPFFYFVRSLTHAELFIIYNILYMYNNTLIFIIYPLK